MKTKILGIRVLELTEQLSKKYEISNTEVFMTYLRILTSLAVTVDMPIDVLINSIKMSYDSDKEYIDDKKRN